MDSQLVAINGNDLFTDSMAIANGTDIQHHAVRELIKKYKSDDEDFGTLLISNEEITGGYNYERNYGSSKQDTDRNCFAD